MSLPQDGKEREMVLTKKAEWAITFRFLKRFLFV